MYKVELQHSFLQLQPQQPSSAVVNSTADQQMSGKVTNVSSNVGKTWSGLGAFNLDIDFKTAPVNATKPAAPSLSQLQSLKQNASVMQSLPPQKSSCGERPFYFQPFWNREYCDWAGNCGLRGWKSWPFLQTMEAQTVD